MPELKGRDEPVEISPGFTIEAPDLLGNVEAIDSRERVRSPDRGRQEPALDAALDAAGMATEVMFELEVTEDLAPTPPGARRRDSLRAATRQGEPAVILSAEVSRPNQDYAVLYTDEGGVSRWIFPEERGRGRQRRGRELTFYLPRAGAPEPPTAADEDRRGPISKLGRRVVRMLMWATDEIAGAGAQAFMANWENRKRPYGFHRVAPHSIGGRPDWDQLQRGRALLLIHGTNSMAQIAYKGLVESDAFARIHEHYGGRVFAFNHPSVHLSPDENIQTFFDMLADVLPRGASLDLDMVTHSRGGLVGRTLMERMNAFATNGRSVRVGKAILVAAPNRGTVLADGDNWIELIDRYTNLLTNLPDNVYTLSLEGILTLVKVIGHGALVKLPGLNSMWPDGEFLRRLNRADDGRDGGDPGSVYYALSADFEPADPNLLHSFGKLVGDKFVDVVFGEQNDGVVPTMGGYAIGVNAHGFPIPPERRQVWTLQSSIYHTNFFYNKKVNEQIAKWLVG